jgi:hypothetical protein
VFRVAATVVMVSHGRKQVCAQGLPECAGNGAHRTLHFIEHHTLEYQVAVRVAGLCEVYPMTFLGEVQRVQTGEEYRVQIHVEQVVEVLAVLAGEGVGGPVATGKRVHECIEGTAQHHEERVAHRVALATAQGGMLQNMRHAGRVRRHRAQRYQKHVLTVFRGQVVVHSPRDGVLVLLDPQLQRLDLVAAQKLECGVALRPAGNHLDHTCPVVKEM